MAFQYGMLMQLLMLLVLLLAATNAVAAATTRISAREGGAVDGKAGWLMAKPDCPRNCSNIEIPYPFGIGHGCYFEPRFEITCDKSNVGPTEPRLMETRMLVDSISLTEGHLQIKQLVNRDCYDAQGKPWGEDQSRGGLSVIPPYTISSDKNRLFVVGCDTYGYFVGRRGNQSYTTGCISLCKKKPNLHADSYDKNESCSGMGCCKTNIPPLLDSLSLHVKSFENHREVHDFNPCGYAFVVKNYNFTFDKTSLQDLNKTFRVPLVLDWQIGAESCEFAKQNKTFACKGKSKCEDKLSSGYICLCNPGFQGNPYLEDNCKDINECALNSTLCKHGKCENKEGNYTCVCDSGYKNLNDITCIKVPSAKPLKISLGVSLSFSVLLVGIFLIYRKQRKSHLEYLKRKYFEANGGELLRKEMAKSGEARYFTEEEVKDKDATNNYDESKKVGQGRYGIVYKGILKFGESKEWVAIKKSKVAAQEQFVNEMTALNEIKHKNVVRFKGCCVDIAEPILVSEFMCKGTLYENIHGKDGKKPSPLPLADQLKIAAETAEALAYMHHDISPPFKHGDVKTSNILIDKECTAKLSGFGASRPARKEDENQTSKSNTITEKSDVYSFGLVLAELLTGIKREENLEKIFLALVAGDKLGQTLDEKIVEGHSDEVKKAGDLAIECLESKEKEGHCPSMKDVASKLRGLVESMKQHPSGGGEAKISSSPTDTANLGGPSASSAIMTSADSSIMEITPHGDGR